MKKLFIIIAIWLGFAVQVSAQKSYEMEVLNLVQANETEFTFDIRMRNTNAAEPFAIELIQFQLIFNDFRNGGLLVFDEFAPVDYLTYVENTTDLVGTAIIPTSGNFTTNSANTVIQWVTDVLGNGAQTTMFNTTEWKRIGTFRLQLRNADNSAFHNFADIEHNIQFNANLVEVLWCNTTTIGGLYYRSGSFAELIPNKTLTNSLADRQLAGYWFEGDGDWDETSLWNNVTDANKNTLPGANSNAIINGNVTIPNTLKSDISLLPDVDGNGGELTVLTGEEPLYDLTIFANGNFRIWVEVWDNDTYTGLPLLSAQGGESAVTASFSQGTVLYIETYRTHSTGGTFINWTGDVSYLDPNTADLQELIMPSENVSLTANWTSGSKTGESLGGNSAKSLFASLTIVPGASLTVDKLFNDNVNGAEAILIKSDATGSGYLIHNNSGVLATVERFLSGEIYHYVSPPVDDQAYTLLTGVLGTDDFYIWDEPSQNWINLNHPDNQPPPDGNNLVTGKGYAVAYASGDLTKSFAGTLNTGLVEHTATRVSTEPLQGFNLVGNPYAAAIDADEFIDANSTLDGGLYFWDETDDYDGVRWDYATYTLLGGTQAGGAGNEPNGFIAPTQGFMILVQSTADIVFNNDMRVTDYAHFFKAEEEKSRVWLSVVGPEEDYNEILVGFHPQGEAGVDRSDAVKFSGNPKLALYTVLEEKDFVIQGLPPFDPTLGYIFPVGLHAGFIGDYTFKARKIENFDSEIEIILEDRLTGVMFDLRGSGEYIATIADDGIVADRFFLHINGSTSVPVIFGEKLTSVYALNSQIHIYSTNAEIVDVEVVNTLGQIIARTPVNAMETSITVPGHNVVYIVKVRTSEGVESHKLLIR